MSKFQNILQMLVENWPQVTDENNPLVRKIAEIATGGNTEQDIKELCEHISDYSDAAFQRGINAANQSNIQ